MKKIAILGANEPLRPFYKRTKELGYEVFGFAWEEGAVCKEYCDKFFPISYKEKDKILEICRELEIDGITSFTLEPAVPIVIYIAQKLSLVGNSFHCLRFIEDKYSMRTRLKEWGVPVPAFHLITNVTQLDSLECEFPLIVKPVDNAGSRGVTKVENRDELVIAYHRAVAYSKKEEVLVEQYIEGREFSVEYISHNGIHYYLATTDKVNTGAPYFVEIEGHEPADISDDINNRIKEIIEKSLTALELFNSPSHSEIKLDDKGELYIVEINPRMGGGCIGSHMVKLSTGYDFIKGVLEVCTNSFTKPEKNDLKCAGVYYLTPDREWVREYINDPTKYDRIVYTEAALIEYEQKQLESNSDCVGCFVYQSKERFRCNVNCD